MKFKIGKPDATGISIVKISGKTTMQDIIDFAIAGAKLMLINRSHKALIDITEEDRKLSMMETLDLINKYPQALREYKFAIVDTKENFNKLQVHEAMALKRGFRMFAFTDHESAIAWLNGNTYNEKARCTTKLCGIPNCTEADD